MNLMRLLTTIPGKRPAPSYYLTEAWRAVAHLERVDCNFTCQCCLGRGYQVHHMTYVRCPGKEKSNDLCVLCEACHRAVHFSKAMAIVRYETGHFLHSPPPVGRPLLASKTRLKVVRGKK